MSIATDQLHNTIEAEEGGEFGLRRTIVACTHACACLYVYCIGGLFASATTEIKSLCRKMSAHN
jgi:hypothetical protein